MTVDTLSLAKTLRDAALTEPQAEAIAAAIGTAVSETDEAHSKSDRLQAEIIARFTNLDHRLDALEQRLIGRIEASRSSLLIWFIGVLIAVGGMFVTIAKVKT